MSRAMAHNLGMFATYEEARERLSAAMPNNLFIAWASATTLAGANAAVLSLPFDNAKTKM